MANSLLIDLDAQIRVRTNGSQSDLIAVSDRDVAGTRLYESTVTVSAGAANQAVAVPAAVAGVGKYIMVDSDQPVKFGPATDNGFTGTQHLVVLGSPYVANLYLSNATGQTATVHILVVG